MEQVSRALSIYAADISGICSALYEYGGMTVIHDASGCNSTYTTHDEPRWYHHDSMVYVSGLTEKDAVLGDDERLINDICIAAEQLSPQFIALCNSPMPAMIGTDMKAAAAETERRTGIRSFYVPTNGADPYTCGADKAFLILAQNYSEKCKKTNALSVNIIGMTPLDFSENCMKKIKQWLSENDIQINTCVGMGSSLDEIRKLPAASADLLVSSCGRSLSEYLYREYDIPCVTGVPFGKKFPEQLITDIKTAADENINIISAAKNRRLSDNTLIIGESIMSASLACAVSADNSTGARIIDATGSADCTIMQSGDMSCTDEDILEDEISKADTVISDPLYKPLCAGKRFISLPHTAFSGRCFADKTAALVGSPINLQGEQL